MLLRTYDSARDREAVRRIWREVGWIQKKEHENTLDVFLEHSHALVAEMGGSAESLVVTDAGMLRYLDQDLTFAGVAGVTTSRIARKRGFAAKLVARAIADEAKRGTCVCGLGMFEQGYYNELGFGTGGYEHWCIFDPAELNVDITPRIPERLTVDDWKDVHAARLSRVRRHGALSFIEPKATRAEMLWSENGFGLGYRNCDTREISHHVWCECKEEDLENGPYKVCWTSYRERGQFLELLALLKSLGDQVRLVKICEPQGIQLQDFLRKPLKMRQVSKGSRFESAIRASAYWQVRICDLKSCLESTHLPAKAVRFNLVLTDPIENYLSDDSSWRGIGGQYIITLGSSSVATEGSDPRLPTLNASVGAFSRLWLGVRSARGLSWTDELRGPPELLGALDAVFRLPEPRPDWDF